MHAKLQGLIAAPFTAFHADGTVNPQMIPRQAERLLESGVKGAFICGTTGEGASLTIAEREAIAARWVEVAGRELTIIVHTGHNSIAAAKALASHAQRIGAAAIAAMPPCFFRPQLPELVECCAEIAGAAPALPFYYYHIPSMTGVALSMARFLEAASHITNLAGVKFTSEDLNDYAMSLAVADGRYDILFGRDEILLCGLALGARGAVGSTYNYSAPVYLRAMSAFAEGDIEEARRHQGKAIEFISLLSRYGGLPAGKAKMKMIGIDCGPTRLPLRSLSAEQFRRLEEELAAVGFFQHITPTGSRSHDARTAELIHQR